MFQHPESGFHTGSLQCRMRPAVTQRACRGKRARAALRRSPGRCAGVKVHHAGTSLPFSYFPPIFQYAFSLCHPVFLSIHATLHHCTPQGALVTNSCILPLSLQAGEQTPSPLSRAPLEQKGRSGTLRQRNASAGYQQNFFPYKPGGSFGAHPMSGRAQRGKSVSVCRGEGREGLRRKCV